MTTREPRIPGPDHPITIEKTGARVVARVGGQVVADSTRALTLREGAYPPVQYIPLDDVDQALLTAGDNESYCPYKGEASYYSIVLPGTQDAAPDSAARLANAVWSYRDPYPSVAAIADHVAFYTDRVDVRVGEN
jgi:uncharacterized protein (DUF427 family)